MPDDQRPKTDSEKDCSALENILARLDNKKRQVDRECDIVNAAIATLKANPEAAPYVHLVVWALHQ